jgi:hypothetical protein
MAEIVLKKTEEYQAISVIKKAIDTEILRLEHAREIILNNLTYFEKQYQISSKQFMEELTVEKSEGKYAEEVEWAGQYQAFLEIDDDIDILKNIEYVIL